jgi:hypothetical protein
MVIALRSTHTRQIDLIGGSSASRNEAVDQPLFRIDQQKVF